MPKIIDYPLNESFAGVNSLQARGVIDTGNNLVNGITGALVIENGVMKSTINDTDEDTATAIRSEITAPAAVIGEYWYNFEFKLAADFAPLVNRIMLMQIHDTPDGGDGGKTVPFALMYEQSGDFTAHVPAQTLPTEGTTARIVPLLKAERDRWYRATLHALWSTTSTGFREFFIDEVPVFKEYGIPTMYSDTTGPYFKCGCYDSTHGGVFGTATAYYRNVSIWSGNDGYNTVMGTTPLLPPPILED